MSETHTLMDGRLHVYRRENSRFWQCATYLNGRNHRQSTKESNIAYAREFARDWYLDRVAEDRLRRRGGLVFQAGQPVRSEHVPKAQPGEKTFREAAGVFEREYEAMTLGERNPSYVAGKGRVLRLYLNPFFGDLPLSQVTAGRIQEYRLHRVTPPSEPARVRYVKDGREMVQFRDVSVVVDDATGERILEIEVRGKRGVGYCKSMPGAVLLFQRVKMRKGGESSDLVFGLVQRELLNAVLDELDLKKDREGNPRTAYSLRHTYICLRLMEGADIYQVAKNCRTSVEMIEKYYASHIANTLDASAINVRKQKPAKRRAASDETT